MSVCLSVPGKWIPTQRVIIKLSVKPAVCLCVCPRKVDPQHAGTAGMMMALFLVIGILSGVNASRLLASLVMVEL